MRRLRNILVALNGSSASFHALEESVRLAQWGKGRVTVITVALSYEGDLSLVGVKNIKAVIEGPSEEILTKAAEIVQAHDVPFRVACEEGEAHLKIAERAETEASDLVILGATSHKSLLGRIFGSIGSKVIEHSSRDVLVIPEKAFLGWEKIILVADMSEYGQSSAELALEIAASYCGDLKAVFLSTGFHSLAGTGAASAEDASESLKSRAQQAGVRCDTVITRNHADRTVFDFAKQHAVNLIVLGVQMRKRFFGFIPWNVADRLIYAAPCPVLVVKTHHDAATTRCMKSFYSTAPV